jgi:hypothetical protein
MKNKTAMQRMLEWTRKTFPMDLDTPRMIEDKIESLLKVEKEQIIEFADEYADAVMGGCIKRAEQYYNETYANYN